MGCPDVIKGKCPFCGKEYQGQTKFFDNICESYNIGDKIADPHISIRLRLKNDCSCGESPVAVITNGILISLEKDNPIFEEEAWGNFRKV